MGRSISRQFITGILIVLVISQGILIGWSYQQERNALEDSLAQKLTIVTSLLSNASFKALSDFDVTYLGILCDETLKDGDFVAITLVDDAGIALIDRGKKSRPTSTIQKGVPLSVGGKTIGTLTIFYTPDRIDHLLTTRLLRKSAVQILIFLAVAFLISIGFRRVIVSRIRGIERVITSMISGDLTVRINDARCDELGSIAAGIDQLGDRLSRHIADISLLSGNVSTIGAEISTTLEQANVSLIHQHDATEEISRSIAASTQSQTQIGVSARKLLELSRSNASSVTEHLQISRGIDERMEHVSSDMLHAAEAVQEIRESASNVSTLAARAASEVETAVRAAEDIRTSFREIEGLVEESIRLNEKTTELITMDGGTAIEQTRMSMMRILNLSTSLADTIGALGSSSKDIGKIISTIAEITDRTKLLALNASIIAAQAGEHGRGFAVVANEMKQLSDRTAQSTSEISAILAAIHHKIAQAVTGAEETTEIVRQGGGVVDHTGEVLEEILSSSRTGLEMVKRIQDAATHQQGKLDEIGNSLSSLRSVNISVSSAARDQSERVTAVASSFDLLKEAIQAVRTATSEQLSSMETMLTQIELSEKRTGDIVNAVHEAQQNSGAICASLSDVVTVGSQTVDAITTLAERMESLTREVDRLHSQMQTYRV
ncbi:MAG: HAMP domain-containing methyl-accepting chemotaxis protein [Desulfuromonadia bacterium]